MFNWDGIVRNSFLSNFPDVTKRSEKRALRSLISTNAGYDLRQYFKKNPSELNKDITVWLTVSDDFDQYLKGRFNTSVPEKDRRLSNQQIEWIKFLSTNGKVDLKFNKGFFTNADSREPESAGMTLIGAEVHSGSMLNGELWHLVAIGLPLDFSPPETPNRKIWWRVSCERWCLRDY